MRSAEILGGEGRKLCKNSTRYPIKYKKEAVTFGKTEKVRNCNEKSQKNGKNRKGDI